MPHLELGSYKEVLEIPLCTLERLDQLLQESTQETLGEGAPVLPQPEE